MKEYFSVNVSEYDPSKNYNVVRPASLNRPSDNAVMFVTPRYIHQAPALKTVKDCLVFWPKEIELERDIAERHVVCLSEEPRLDFCRFFRDHDISFIPQPEEVAFINGAFISPKAKLGHNVTVMPGAYISGECEIGDGSYIGCGSKLMGKVLVGSHVIIRENSVIGADSLSTRREPDGTPVTMPQFGYVVLEDFVQVGSNVVISRGAIDETRIRKHAKLDNTCFIAHNVVVGENSFVVGNALMMGSSSVGKNSMISGNSSLMNLIHVGDNALVGMGAVVVKNVPDGAIVKGNPAR